MGIARHSTMTTDCCRTVAAAVLGDTAKEKFVPLSPRLRVTVRKAHDETIVSGKVGDCGVPCT